MPFYWPRDDAAFMSPVIATENARQVSRPRGGQKFRELFALENLINKRDNLRVQDPGPIRSEKNRLDAVSKIALSLILYLTLLFLASLLGGAS
jgi:hypothetical protein